MVAKVYIDGEIGVDLKLLDVIRQFKSFEDPEEAEFIIDSIGGCVDTGEAIYRFIKNLEIPTTTVAKKAYSIAAEMFMAGDKRIVWEGDKRLMIHFGWIDPKTLDLYGKAEDYEYVAEILRDLEKEHIKFYTENLGFDEDTIRELLDEDTYLSAQEALDLGFATEIKKDIKVAAIARVSNLNLNKSKMSETKKKKSIIARAIEALKNIEVRALVLQDENSNEIDFPDLEDGDTPKVGDKAEIGGEAIPDGTYIMPSLDNVRVVFVDGVITEINEAENTEEQASEKPKTTAKKKPGIKAAEIIEISTWDIQVVNETFAMGDIIEAVWEEGGEPYSVGAREFKLPDGRKCVTDASGAIVFLEDEPTSNEEPATEASERESEEEVNQLVSAIKAAAKEAAKESTEELKKEIEKLKKASGSKDLDLDEEETTGKSKKGLNEMLRARRRK